MSQQENKIGVMPVKRLVLSMFLPMMISMLVQALYNVVDSYFVAKLSENALAAVWWAFPIAEIAAVILSVLFLRHSFRTVVAPLDDGAAA